MTSFIPHQYIDRDTSEVITESLFKDKMIRFIYSQVRESAPRFYQALISPRFSSVLGFLNYDFSIGEPTKKIANMIRELDIDLSECVDPPEFYDSPRKLFERKIKYWECRKMSKSKHHIASPADSKILIGSFKTQSHLFIKEKFFSYQEMIGEEKKVWKAAFSNGDFAICRLTPEKYHYNHFPVSGKITDIYEIEGVCHSCNPGAIIQEVSPLSKNRRTVTIIDTDVENGTGIGLVCMVEVTALMIGKVKQYYSERYYDSPKKLEVGMFVMKGQPKSVYLPGSSVDVLIFQENQIKFTADIRRNLMRSDASSRFSWFFGRPLVETDVKVRSTIAIKKNALNGKDK